MVWQPFLPVPVHDVQDKGLRHLLIVRLVIFDEYRAYY